MVAATGIDATNDTDTDMDMDIYPPVPSLNELRSTLVDEKQPIAKRTRTLFLLKQVGTHAAIDVLAEALTSSSVLLSHEVAYVLGQMKDPYAIPYLNTTLADTSLNPITRHEAAEALAAIGHEASVSELQKYADSDTSPSEVIDTCRIAIDSIRYQIEDRKSAYLRAAANGSSQGSISKYSSIDPAAPFHHIHDVDELQRILCDRSETLFNRYRAMFTLRNIASNDEHTYNNNNDDKNNVDDQRCIAAINALTVAFQREPQHSEGGSAVFRHEIAYVLGQLANSHATDALVAVLKNYNEHAMTRHEAAEALGAIAGLEDDDNDNNDVQHTTLDTKTVKYIENILQEHLNDNDVIVAESCQVALDIADYWKDDTQFDTAVDAALQQ